MLIREVAEKDIADLLGLYSQLNNMPISEVNKKSMESLKRIIENKNQHILVAEINEKVVATVTLTIIESLTHGIRPYGVIEHLITDENSRGKGLATKLIEKAKDIAKNSDCYKIMLITGRQGKHVHELYQKDGFKSDLKTAYVMELD